ncbi:MAG: hypothetical protein ACRENU_16705, partial [Gemmatimonadaceae bacterium]
MRARLLAACLVLTGTATAHAQQGVSVRAARRDTLPAGSTATATFEIATLGDAVTFTPAIEVPAGWTVLMGGGPVSLAPRSREMLI